MILMQTRFNFTMPDTTSAKFVTVAAFGHKNITRMKSILQIFIGRYFDSSQIVQINITALHICNS